jgi:NAD(P)H-dependent FMN reductase
MTLTDKVDKRVLVINGSYREGGITDQLVGYACAQLQRAGAETEVIDLRAYPIEFCLNCRECMQSPGATPGHCVIDDGMAQLVERIEAADAYILAAPTNFSSVSAVFKRFMERLAVYAYWPWGQRTPEYRKAGLPPKKALLISSSAAPGFFGRWLFGSGRQLRIAAKTIGARPVGLVFSGMASQQKNPGLPRQTMAATQSMLHKLLS